MKQKILKNFSFYIIIYIIGFSTYSWSQEILNKGESYYVKNGDSLELSCHIKNVIKLTNDESISVAWSQGQDTGLIASDMDVQDESGRYDVSMDQDHYKLIIPSITLDDDKKTFVCTSYSEGEPYQITHNVFIGEPPTASIIGKKNKTILEGEEFVLECQVSGIPSPEVTWLHEDKPLPKGVKTNENKLIFEKAKFSYAGNYKCIASNSLGTASVQSKINIVDASKAIEFPVEVKEHVKVYDKSEQVSSEFGKELNLTCKYTAYPEASVLWTFNGRPLDDIINEKTTKIFAYQEGKYTFSVLNINTFQISNIGQYKCNVGNGRGGNESKIINVIPIIPEVDINVSCNTLYFETTFQGDINKLRLYWKTPSSLNFSVLEIESKDFTIFKPTSNGMSGAIELADYNITKNHYINFETILETTEYGDFKSKKQVTAYIFDEKNPGKLRSSNEYLKCFDTETEPSSGNRNSILLTKTFISALLFIAFGILM
uniref:Ig-like domain-containing protein n=1 Tax=Strongyloides stercoralis TaxID=6248 RepID=A0A0K0E631_STRER